MIERKIEIVRETETEREIPRTEKVTGAKKERGIVKEKIEIKNLHGVTHLLEREKGRELETEALEEIDPGALVLGKGCIPCSISTVE